MNATLAAVLLGTFASLFIDDALAFRPGLRGTGRLEGNVNDPIWTNMLLSIIQQRHLSLPVVKLLRVELQKQEDQVDYNMTFLTYDKMCDVSFVGNNFESARMFETDVYDNVVMNCK